MYVNLLTRRPDHFNFRNSTKLQNFVAANEIIFRLYGKLNNNDLKASEKYYSLRNWFISFCLGPTVRVHGTLDQSLVSKIKFNQ